MKLKKSISISLFFFYVICFGQKIKSDEFDSKFIKNNEYGELIYCGDNKQIILKFIGKNILEDEEANTRENKNQYLISVDQILIQSLITPIQNHFKKTDKLNYNEVERILINYVESEMIYITKEMKVNVAEYLRKFGNYKSREYLLWKYKMPDYENSIDGETIKTQIYISTICYNQILTLNIPIVDLSLENKCKRILVNMVRRIKMKETNCISDISQHGL